MNKLNRFAMIAVLAMLAGGCASSPAVAQEKGMSLLEAVLGAEAGRKVEPAQPSAEELARQKAFAQAVLQSHKDMQALAQLEAQTRDMLQTRINSANSAQVFSDTVQKLAGQMASISFSAGIRGLLSDDPAEKIRLVKDPSTGGNVVPYNTTYGLGELLEMKIDPSLNAQENARSICLSKAAVDSATLAIARQISMVGNPQGYSPEELVGAVQGTLDRQASVLSALDEFARLEQALRKHIESQPLSFLEAVTTGPRRYNGELRSDPRFTCLPKTTIVSGALTLTEQAERILGFFIPAR